MVSLFLNSQKPFMLNFENFLNWIAWANRVEVKFPREHKVYTKQKEECKCVILHTFKIIINIVMK